MKHYVYSVFDTKAEAFLRPFFVPTHGLAIRSFENEVLTDGSPMNMNPEDYSLFQIGVFVDDDASFESVVPPKVVLTGVQVFVKSRAKSNEVVEE